MVWQSEIDELKHRQELAAQMGGPESIARHHEQGKLTVRERIAALADPGSFQEIGVLAGSSTYDQDRLVAFTPANNIIGICTLDGRRVIISGGDFTIRGGAADAGHGQKSKQEYATRLALEWHLPFIRLLDAVGGSVRTFELIGRTYMSGSADTATPSHLLQIVPVVSAVLGSVAGLPAVEACISHFSVMIKGNTQLFAGGPPVVKAALGYDINKEDLGGYKVIAQDSGTVDNVARNEEEAFQIIRRFLSYLPSNVWEMAPRLEPTDDPNRRDEEILSIVPKERNKAYNPYTILKHVLDRDSFFEIAPLYGCSRRTGLGRVNGYPVGVMINDPRFMGGAMDVAAGEKAMRLIQLCDTFHLPMVYFADEPGFMVGLDAQRQGIVRAGARVVVVTNESRMPWAVFAVRQLYGVAGGAHIRHGGMCVRYAWPSAHWGSMHIEGGTAAAYRREIEAADDPKAKLEEIERKLKAIASPLRTAEAFDVEDIIDPRETRPLLVSFVETAQSALRTQLGPGRTYRP